MYCIVQSHYDPSSKGYEVYTVYGSYADETEGARAISHLVKYFGINGFRYTLRKLEALPVLQEQA